MYVKIQRFSKELFQKAQLFVKSKIALILKKGEDSIWKIYQSLFFLSRIKYINKNIQSSRWWPCQLVAFVFFFIFNFLMKEIERLF